MNRFKQHIPSFVATDEKAEWVEFSTTSDLLELPIVKRYTDSENFSHFALWHNYLMEICDDGFYWWVVGYIEDPTSIELPEWAGAKYRALLPNGEIEVLAEDEVVSSCSGVLTLQNGSTVEYLKGKP